MTTTYPKRLIEVDLPVARISAHARHEKSVRHGHISTLHIWWARRPLAACRAVVCASLWPDPVSIDDAIRDGREAGSIKLAQAYEDFLACVREQIAGWSENVLSKSSPGSFPVFNDIRRDPAQLADPYEVRRALLCFVADFADWKNATDPDYLRFARTVTASAHRLNVHGQDKPLVMDPFAGGGAIPLEASRLGADVFASDLNPVAVLLNKALIEFLPRYGDRLSKDIRRWGEILKAKALAELESLYPPDSRGGRTLAYLWARTARCEGPGCGFTFPLVRSAWLSTSSRHPAALHFECDEAAGTVNARLLQGTATEAASPGTLKRGSATCPACGYTTPAARIRSQFEGREGGANDAMLLAVYADGPGGRYYREPEPSDIDSRDRAAGMLSGLERATDGRTPSPPSEELPYLRSIFNIQLLGVTQWRHLFTARQTVALVVLCRLVREAFEELKTSDADYARALSCLLAFAVDRQADYASSICTWVSTGEFIGHTFAQNQCLPIKWDFAEVAPFGDGSGNWDGAIEWIARVIEHVTRSQLGEGATAMASATSLPLPDDSVDLCVTDPPYYDAVPYADLSDFFYVWLKRSLGTALPEFFGEETTPKNGEIVQLAERNPKYAFKTREYFEVLMQAAFAEARRVVRPDGLAVVVFAHTSTDAWESVLAALIGAGWTTTASWPIDTEMGARLRARNSSVLASSIHLVCRPREHPDGSLSDGVGEWREVLAELPKRIHEWMPRLAAEGVVGADAIFACLGPALEVFSRYSRVDKASGETVPLREYLEQVWAAVSREALSMIFDDPETAGLEPDARLTAMWLWTVGGNLQAGDAEDLQGDETDGGSEAKSAGTTAGYSLEFDAARKIAQGLGIHLEKASSVASVKGDKAFLLPVAARTRYLFGRDSDGEQPAKKAKNAAQMDLFAELQEVDAGVPGSAPELAAPEAGRTVLDRVHQAMILFGSGRGEALKRFLVEDGIGKQAAVWTLAQALSALYPTGSDEKRWVDGVLARKKGLGL